MLKFLHEEDSSVRYVFFDKDDNQTEEFREKDIIWEKKEGSEWIACSGTIIIYGRSNDSYIYTFDDGGRILSVQCYEDDTLTSTSQYIYEDNGYEVQTFLSNDDGELIISKARRYEFEEDVRIFYNYMYNYAGKLIEGRKEVYYYEYDGYIFYNLDLSSNTWKYFCYSGTSKQEVLDDGTVITIDYDVDKNLNIIPWSKSVYKNTESYECSEDYFWNPDLESWTGYFKYEQRFIEVPVFKLIYPKDPLPFNDDYFTEEMPSETKTVSGYWISEVYDWDTDKSDWIKTEERFLSIFEVYGLTLKDTTSEGYTIITVDEDRRVDEKTIYSTASEGNPVSYTKWEYDSEGDLIYMRHVPANPEDEYTYTYSYEYVTVNDLQDIKARPEGITVYNLQGIPILKGASEDSLRNLDKGLYIISNKNLVNVKK